MSAHQVTRKGAVRQGKLGNASRLQDETVPASVGGSGDGYLEA
jgi:hypothetical protein